jgi:hypothetical protein
MTPEQRAREFVEVGFRSFGVPLEPYVQIIAELIAGAEADLHAEIERLKKMCIALGRAAMDIEQQLRAKEVEVERLKELNHD